MNSFSTYDLLLLVFIPVRAAGMTIVTGHHIINPIDYFVKHTTLACDNHPSRPDFFQTCQ